MSALAEPCMHPWADVSTNGKCARFSAEFITADGELARVGVTREGFMDQLREFDDDETAEYDGETP